MWRRVATPVQNSAGFVLRWGAAGIALLMLTGWASTYWVYAQVSKPKHGEVILAGGAVMFRNAHYWDNVPGIDLSDVLFVPPPAWSLHTFALQQSVAEWSRSLVWLPAWERARTWKGNTSMLVCMPLWIPFAMSAAASAWAWRRHWKRNRHGFCAECGYDRTGLPEGAVCPECGATPPQCTNRAGVSEMAKKVRRMNRHSKEPQRVIASCSSDT